MSETYAVECNQCGLICRTNDLELAGIVESEHLSDNKGHTVTTDSVEKSGDEE